MNTIGGNNCADCSNGQATPKVSPQQSIVARNGAPTAGEGVRQIEEEVKILDLPQVPRARDAWETRTVSKPFVTPSHRLNLSRRISARAISPVC